MLSDVLALKTLLFPPRCLTCQLPGVEFCDACLRLWKQPAKELCGQGIPFFSVVSYRDQARKCILAAKEDGNRSARQALVMALRSGLEGYIRTFPSTNDLVLVPLPSRKAAVRRRGRDHVLELCQDLAKMDQKRISTVSLFGYQRPVRDQSLLGIAERSANLHGAFLVRSQQLPHLTRKDLILVDDLVTSGATIREGIRALAAWNEPVSGVISACAAPSYF